MPYFIQRQGDKHCVMKGVKGEEGVETVKCHPDPASAKKHLSALMVNVEDAKSTKSTDESIGESADESSESKSQSAVVLDAQSDRVGPRPDQKNKFISYKSGDQWRWLAISSTAVEDREYETVSEKAYDDAITYASLNGYGALDLVHVDGTEVGKCDQMFRVGQSLLEGGTWNDSDLAQKVRDVIQSNQDKWGVSIKFQYDPEQFDGSIYHGGIRILKRSILPRKMAASLGTAIVVQGGKAMKAIDETTKEALMELGMDESEVTELAEQQKSLPDEPNVKEKETEDKVEEKDEGILDKIKRILLGETPEQTAQPDAEEQSTTDTEVEQVKTQEKEVVQPESEYILTEEAVKTISLETAKVISPAIAKALNPIVEQVQSLIEWSESVQKRLQEVEKDIETKVSDKIAQLPPVVKVRTTELKAALDPEQPETQAESLSKNAEFVQAITGIVQQALGSGEFKL